MQQQVSENGKRATEPLDLRFNKVTLAFKDVWYSIKSPHGENIDLIKGVTGMAEPGTMTALMGR